MLQLTSTLEPASGARDAADSSMQPKKAILYGVLGAGAISVISVGLRAIGLPIRMELILGTVTGLPPGPAAYALGLAMHLAIGGAFGLLYGWLFETVWNHGGASVGMILGTLHAAIIGMAVGLTPHFHPAMGSTLSDPGPYFANGGTAAVLAFFAIHMVYGAIVGQGYGHVRAEREWAPAGRL
jgi:hypothetical protein